MFLPEFGSNGFVIKKTTNCRTNRQLDWQSFFDEFDLAKYSYRSTCLEISRFWPDLANTGSQMRDQSLAISIRCNVYIVYYTMYTIHCITLRATKHWPRIVFNKSFFNAEAVREQFWFRALHRSDWAPLMMKRLNCHRSLFFAWQLLMITD